MIRYRKDTVSRLLSKRDYFLHQGFKEGKKSSFYTLIDPDGKIIRERMEALDLVIIVFAKVTGQSYFSLIEELESMPPPTLTPAEELAIKAYRSKTSKQDALFLPLLPCPFCLQIRHQKLKTNRYKCLSCNKNFKKEDSQNIKNVNKVRKKDRRIKDGRPHCPSCYKDSLVRAWRVAKNTVQVFKCKNCQEKVKLSINDLHKHL